MMDKMYQEALDAIRQKTDLVPEIGIILGSGLGGLAARIENPVAIPYGEIPHMKTSTAPGHTGQFVLGTISGKKVVCMQGRLHFYEGHTMQEIAFPVRLMKLMGIETLFVTNACGAVNTDFSIGDLMLIEDHINMMGANPLTGPNAADFGPRFCDMTFAYTPALREIAELVAEEQGVKLQKGVYLGYMGPNYETPAEIRAFRTMGADTVGMSTVPEVLTASHCGLNVLAISLITNMAAGIQKVKLSEQEVIDTAAARAKVLQGLVEGILAKL